MRRRSTARVGAILAGVVVTAMLAGCGVVPRAEQVLGHADDTRSDRTPGATPAPAPSGVSKDLQRYYRQRLTWEPCDEGSTLQCTTLRVPLDYDNPGGKSIELAVLRYPAQDQERKLGSLVINPGGPGGSGVEYAAVAPFVISRPVLERYDIVGFDPRGVGRSAPVDCVSDRQLDAYHAADGSPDNAAERRELQRIARQFAAGCKRRSGDLLPHVSTEDAARDMDILRGALGDEELTYLGKSYGTFLGATYADLFPSRAGRLVLDGAVDPTLSARDLSLEQAKGFEVALKAFLEDCVQREDCPLGRSLDEAYRNLDAFLARVDRNPLPTSSRRRLTQALATTGIIMPLYVKEYWPRLRNALASALDGNGSRLLALADEYTERNPDGSYRSNASEVILAVNCIDRPDVTSVEEILREEPVFRQASPRFGSFILWGSLTCAEWPVKPVGKPGPIHAKGTKPILVIGTTRDPATPYEWSRSLAEQLEAGVLLTREGDGHTAYMQGNRCVDEVVEAFLLEGEPPEDGMTCPES